jgi:hypothetical protein
MREGEGMRVLSILIIAASLTSAQDKSGSTEIPICGSPEAKKHPGMCVDPNPSAELIDGKCSICVKEGQKSTVTMNGYGSCTLAYCGSGHYD